MEEVVASADHGDVRVERFVRNGGTVMPILGGIVVVAFIVGWAVDRDGVPLWVPALALLIGALLYTSTVRPRVMIRGHDLVLRNMVSTTVIPLAAVDQLAVRQVLAVRVGDNRHVCAGVGRSFRQAVRGMADPAGNYADFVELRLQELVNEDRARRGVKRFSAEADQLGEQVRREHAWPEIVALAVTGLFFVVAVVVALVN
jgi:hypothetical protein